MFIILHYTFNFFILFVIINTTIFLYNSSMRKLALLCCLVCLINIHFFLVFNFFDRKLYSTNFKNITLLNFIFLKFNHQDQKFYRLISFLIISRLLTIFVLLCFRLLTTRYICSFKSLLSTLIYGFVQLSR